MISDTRQVNEDVLDVTVVGGVEDDPDHDDAGLDRVTPTKELYLILYPKEREDTIVRTLEEIGVPGYTELPKCVGRGQHVRHFDNQIWPGATGAIFTVMDAANAPTLLRPFRRLNRELEARSHGQAGLHIFALPCRQLI